MTNLPRLYVNNKFTRLVHPITVGITQNIEPLNTATITLPKGEELPARSYVELFTPYGSAGMFRVRSPHNAYGEETSSAELEHMIAEVGDYLVKGEYSDMRGASSAVSTAFSYYRGNKWQLGSYSAIGDDAVAFEAKYDSVLNVLLNILDQKPDCMMTFDFSTTPWRVNIVKKGTSVVAEGRLSRNVSSAMVTYDDSELTTRVWYQTFSHDNEGNINNYWTYRDADTINTYGIIEGRVQTSSDMTGSEINKTVNEFIRSHRQPKTSVRIQASELAHITGERIDKFFIGDLMRLALPDYGLTVELNITSITWSDVYNNPNSISIQLGEEEDTVVTFLHNLDATGSGSGSSSGRGGGGAAGKEAESWSIYKTLTDEYGKILKEAGIYLDANGTLIYAQDTEQNLGSRFNVTAEAISAEVERASNAETVLSGNLSVEHNRITAEVAERKNGDEILSGRITIEKDRITQEVTNRQLADATLTGQITVQADRITQEVTRAEGTLSGRITVEAGRINQIVTAVGSDGQVTAASICLAINSEGSSATINADKIYLLGQTIANTITADYIKTKIASLSAVIAQALAVTGAIACSRRVSGSEVAGADVLIGSQSLKSAIVSATVSNNTLTLTDVDGNAVTFSKATTLSGAWSSGVFTVSASPQGVSKTTSLTVGGHWGVSADQEDTKHYYGEIKATIDSSATLYDTGKTFEVDASGIYTSGRNSVTISSIGVYGDPAASATSISVQAVASNGASDIGSINITSQRNNAYNSGYDAGWNACRTATSNSGERLSYYTGTVTTKYDAPSVGATARQVIYPYQSGSATLYTIPDRR